MRLTNWVSVLVLWASVLSGAAGMAAVSETHISTPVHARLITATNGVAPDTGQISAGLHLDLQGDWKTYWRSPGEVGIPPEITWDMSENIKEVTMLWPAPTRFEAFDIENFGYAKEVVFPFQIMLEEPGQPAILNATVSLLVCETVCVPENFTLSLPLGSGVSIDPSAAELIAQYAAKVPTEADQTLLAALTPDKTALQIDLPLGDWQVGDVFVEYGITSFGPPVFEGGGTRAVLPIGYLDDETLPISVTLKTQSDASTYAVERRTILPPLGDVGLPSIWMFIGFAFLGGLILNVMPCVLPVLAIKFASALNHSSANRGRISLSFLASALGVMAFILTLAIAVIALRASGQAVGWGMHFQNPYFLIFMMILIAGFTANLLGLFEFRLPGRWSDSLGKSGGGDTLMGDVATGAFAAILATPCSAPFLGTAVAFALSNSAAHILVIFTALGLGLAMPYLLIAMRPQLVQALPKPGPWMIRVRLVLAAMLGATLLWLLSIFATNAGLPAAFVTVGLIALGVALLAFAKLRISGPAIAVLVVAGFMLPGFFPEPARATDAVGDWENFAQNRISEAVANGETVFVDVTADWCLTCKANKRLVLNSLTVTEALAEEGVLPLRADWTRPDPAITEFLNEHGRFGIPFNIVFGPDAPNGIALPEILKTPMVLDAIKRAGH